MIFYKIFLRNPDPRRDLTYYSSDLIAVLSTLKNVSVVDVYFTSKIIFLLLSKDDRQQHKFLGFRFKHRYSRDEFCDPEDSSRMFDWKWKRNFSQKDWNKILKLKSAS